MVKEVKEKEEEEEEKEEKEETRWMSRQALPFSNPDGIIAAAAGSRGRQWKRLVTVKHTRHETRDSRLTLSRQTSSFGAWRRHIHCM